MTRRVDERTDARERALILLYEAESKRVAPLEVLDAQVLPPDELTRELVEGVAANQKRLETPVLMLTGEHFYCRDKVEVIGARIRDFRWFELKGGRFCASWEKADEIAARVIAFAGPEA